ncbi:hypothetical protein [Pseudomonas japonica]|uniref:hypothetical protein n=1 Tax=Pseudomonas japonica TaxID=256466 RepID=UPI0015E3BCFC|nr:hypothetical protein [Pseudomonas japonica]MBA1241370.1 hypothetical protein [Pseudomonas japonica]
MQNNPNESYYDENGTLTLAVTQVWDIEPEPTLAEEPQTHTWLGPINPGAHIGSAFDPDIYLRPPPASAVLDTESHPGLTAQEKITKIATGELLKLRAALDAELEKIPTRLTTQINKLIESNPRIGTATAIQEAATEIEIIDRMLISTLQMQEYFAKGGNYEGLPASSITGQAFASSLEESGDINNSTASARRLTDLKAAVGYGNLAERMRAEVTLLRQKRAEAEARLNALTAPADTLDPSALFSQLTELKQRALGVVEDQPGFIADRIKSYFATADETSPDDAINAIVRAVDRAHEEYYVPEDEDVSFYKLNRVRLSKPDLAKLYDQIKTGGSFLFDPERNLKDEAARYLTEAKTQLLAIKHVAQAKGEQLTTIRAAEAARAAEIANITAQLEAERQRQIAEEELQARHHE